MNKIITETSMRQAIKYNEKYGFYFLNGSANPIALKEETKELLEFFELNEYSKIFAQYDPITDYVTCTDRYTGSNYIILHRHSNSDSILPAGSYRLTQKDYDIVLIPFEIDRDEYIPLESECSHKIVDDVALFFEKEGVYNELSLLHKRACLLFGPPGNGKTYSIFKAVEDVSDAVVIFLDDKLSLSNLIDYKEPLRGRKVIIVIEELTERLSSDTGQILRFLDGEHSWANAYTICTTNYPEELPENLVDRPGRFDLLVEVPNANMEDRKAYLENFLDDVTEYILAETHGLSLGYLKEIVSRSRIQDISFLDALKLLKKERERVSDRFKGSLSDPFGI